MFIDMHACDGGSERHGRGGCALEIIRVGCGGPEHGEEKALWEVTSADCFVRDVL